MGGESATDQNAFPTQDVLSRDTQNIINTLLLKGRTASSGPTAVVQIRHGLQHKVRGKQCTQCKQIQLRLEAEVQGLKRATRNEVAKRTAIWPSIPDDE